MNIQKFKMLLCFFFSPEFWDTPHIFQGTWHDIVKCNDSSLRNQRSIHFKIALYTLKGMIAVNKKKINRFPLENFPKFLQGFGMMRIKAKEMKILCFARECL